MIIAADTIVLATGTAFPGWVRIVDGIVVELGRGEPLTPPDDAAAILLPGLVDIHDHGARGHDFGTLGDDPSDAIDHHMRHGTTSLVASLASSPFAELLDRVRELAPLVRAGALAGLHLEGPWLSPTRRGAHHESLLHPPHPREVERMLAAGDGTVRMVTLAPELPGAFDAIARLVAGGVIVALGHSDASAETTRRALDAGATVATHLFNGMRPFTHRDPGIAGAAWGDRRVALEAIADGVHLDDAVVDLLLATAPTRVVLVSDAMSATGMGDGVHELAGSRVRVVDGVARTEDGASLAGGTATLGEIVEHRLARGDDALTVSLAASSRPAAALGLPTGTVQVGGTADFIEVGEGRIRRVMKDGVWLASSS